MLQKGSEQYKQAQKLANEIKDMAQVFDYATGRTNELPTVFK